MTAPVVVPVAGTTEEAFAPLRDVLPRVAAAQGGGGCALAVVRDGRLVVDLVAGDYALDSLQLVFSVTKAVTTIAVAQAVEAGEFDLDEPFAAFWPEFDRPTTRAITARMVLGHRSGIAAVTDPAFGAAELWAGGDIDAVARQEPLWEPGTRHGYHALTFGALLDGALRRRTGRPISERVAEGIAQPLGAEFWLGMPESVAGRLAPVRVGATATTAHQVQRAERGEVVADRALGVFSPAENWNAPELVRGSNPSAGGVTDARSLARILGATLAPVDGVRLLATPTVEEWTRTTGRGVDAMLGIDIHFGTGFQLPFPQLPFMGPGSYGHEAAGGSFAFADRETGLAVAFVTDVFPPMHGASVPGLALPAAIRQLAAA